MRPVSRRSSSELRISVLTVLKDAATLSWLGLVKQACLMPIRQQLLVGQCQWCSHELEPERGKNSATDYCRAHNCSSTAAVAVAAAKQLGAALAAEQLHRAAFSIRSSSLAAHYSSSSFSSNKPERGAACSSSNNSSRQRATTYCAVYIPWDQKSSLLPTSLSGTKPALGHGGRGGTSKYCGTFLLK